MGRWQVVVVVSAVLLASSRADAQSPVYTGLLTGHVGSVRGGEVSEPSRTGGGSMAVVDSNGIGAEIDVAHTDRFDVLFAPGAGQTSFMFNFVAAYPHRHLRPFVVLGVGLVRLRTYEIGGATRARDTEAAWDAGAGAYLLLNDFLGVRGDIRYLRLFSNPGNVAVSGDGLFDYWRASIGATLSWSIR